MECPEQLIGVICQFCGIKRNTTDGSVNDTIFIYAERNFTAFDIADSSRDILSNSTRFGVGHQTTRAEDTADTTYLTHDLRHSNDYVHICPTALYFLDQFFQTNIVSSGSFGFGFFVGSTEYSYPFHFTGAVRQGNRAANRLIGFARVHAQANVNVNGSIKFGGVHLLDQGHSFRNGVELGTIYLVLYGFPFFR